MIRTILSSAAIAAMLSAVANGQALSQVDGRDFQVWQKNLGSTGKPTAPKKAKKARRPGSLSSQPTPSGKSSGYHPPKSFQILSAGSSSKRRLKGR